MNTDKKITKESGWFMPLIWFILILAGFWVLWYYSGGPERTDVNNGPFIDPQSTQGYGSNGN